MAYCVRQGVGVSARIPEIVAAAGYEVTRSRDAALDVSETDVVWLQGNAGWFPKIRQSLARAASRPVMVVWHTEPLPLPSAAGRRRPLLTARELGKIVLRDTRATDVYSNSAALKKLSAEGHRLLLVVSTAARREFLAEKGIEAEHVPLGRDDAMGRDMKLKRDVDVLFIGTPHAPRHVRGVAQLRERGVSIVSTGGWGDKGIWGEERTTLINRAKIFVNIQRHPLEMSGFRMLLGMACRALVISEPIYRPEPYLPGVHYVEAPLADFPEAIEFYLNNDEARTSLADAGHHFVTRELTMEHSVARILEMLERKFN